MRVVISITQAPTADADEVFVDVSCDEGNDVSRSEAIGILERAKDVLLRG